MNSSSGSGVVILVPIVFYQYGTRYISTPTAFACTLTNAFNIVVLLDKQLKLPTYQYLLWKSVFETLFGFNNIFTFSYSIPSFQQSFLGQIYFVWGMGFAYYFLLYGASFVDIAIAYDRLLILQNKLNRSKILDVKYLIPIVTIISFFGVLPLSFSVKIVLSPDSEASSYTYVRSEFGTSVLYSLYVLANMVIFNIIFNIVMIVLSIRVIISYRNYLKSKSKISKGAAKTAPPYSIPLRAQTSSTEARQSSRKNKINKMVILICLMCLEVRLIESASYFVNGAAAVWPQFAIFNGLFLFVTRVNSAVVLSLSFFVYCHFNTVFRRVFISYVLGIAPCARPTLPKSYRDQSTKDYNGRTTNIALVNI